MSRPCHALEKTLADIFLFARSQRHEYVTVEHLLLGLLEDEDVNSLLQGCGSEKSILVKELKEYIVRHIDIVPEDEIDNFKVLPTVAVQRILSRSALRSAHHHKSEFDGSDVLASLFGEEDSHAVSILRHNGVERIDVLNYIAHGDSGRQEEYVRHEKKPGKPAEEGMLARLTQNLNEEAKAGRIDPLIGREQESQRVMQILLRRRKNNPLLVGSAGVGKTAIAEGLALNIISGKVPPLLSDCIVYSLDMGAVIAGTRYRGDFEQRLKTLLNQFVNDPMAILFIDEIHTLIGAGSTSGSMMDAANMFKPLLSSGKLRCIGATTYEEFQTVFERDTALARRFQKIDVVETGVRETYLILKGLRKHFEKHHQLNYTDIALHRAAELSDRHIGGRYLPDKAIDVIDEAAAGLRLKATSRRRVGVAEIESVVASMARIPERRITMSERDRLANLESVLKQSIFGQDCAIETLVSAIHMSRAGLRDENRPVGSFLFAGPTGVGKTELARQLAKVLEVQLLRFDMSEYQERHTVSRLIGAPPGYVGYERGGLMTDAVNKQPYSVILLDEIEKAHREVYNLLLQVMDRGILTDSHGREVNFCNTVLIMTSNAGAEHVARRTIGFSDLDHSQDAITEVEKQFAPEFRNRLDAVVFFEPLDLSAVKTVAQKFLTELQGRLKKREVNLQTGEGVVLWLAEHGYNRQLGARPMKRLIQDLVLRPLADLLLFKRRPREQMVVELKCQSDRLVIQQLSQETLPESDLVR